MMAAAFSHIAIWSTVPGQCVARSMPADGAPAARNGGLLAGTLLIALVAFGVPGAARAACVPSLQTISGAVVGPVLSNGGAITVTSTGSIAGKPDGVDATSCSITTLASSGTINGGSGAGAGVRNSQTITTLSNKGTMGGGAGGIGLSNTGTISSLGNSGVVTGGVSATSSAPGGVGVSNGHVITSLTNSGTITGGNGVNSIVLGDASLLREGDAPLNAMPLIPVPLRLGAGGVGLSNAGPITTLTNHGDITGGSGGSLSVACCCLPPLECPPPPVRGGNGGNGMSNSGSISSLTNTGSISEGAPGSGPSGSGSPGDAISSTGSLGHISNSGQIIGNILIFNQASLTITGGSGTTFGRFSNGTIDIRNGNLSFAGGNTDLADSIAVNSGAGEATNSGELRLAASQTITGNLVQSSSGTFVSLIAGDSAGKYGALAATGDATLDGGLALTLTNGFTLAAGDSLTLFSFAAMHFTSPSGDFRTLTFDGAACVDNGHRVWSCPNLAGLNLAETITASALEIKVVAK